MEHLIRPELPNKMGAAFPWLRTAFILLGLCSASLLGGELHLTSPMDWQVVQRSARNQGVVRIQGTCPTNALLEWRVQGPTLEGRLPEGWRPLKADTRQGSLLSEIWLPAGGWYHVEIRVLQDGVESGRQRIEHVGIGEVFVVAGQSNSANHGEERQNPKSSLVTSFDGKRWQPARDPQPGASGEGGSFLPPLGDYLANEFGVPIGWVSCGVGATSVREWLPAGTRFANPPTLTGNVTPLSSGGWESKGILFQAFTARMKTLGIHGFRAVLWHQGESDANQQDATRTLPGNWYEQYLAQLIQESQKILGWKAPWFVAQASYHVPSDPKSQDIRDAQRAVWEYGLALEGPDSDALTGTLREGGGTGVHFSGPGLREHARQWATRVGPWLEAQVRKPGSKAFQRLTLPGWEDLTLEGRPAFVVMPPKHLQRQPQPWVLYAPTLPCCPDEAERWMHEQFLAAGIAIAGIDVGEAYGSPQSHPAMEALYQELIQGRHFSKKPCLLGRSRGGLWATSWALAHPDWVSGLMGIYPVFDLRTYPGLAQAAPAYGLSTSELERKSAQLNPVVRLDTLAKAGIPAVLIHGDVDTVVPLKENSGEMVRLYQESGAGSLIQLIILKGQGHNFFEGFFHSKTLVDFGIQRAKAGAAH